MPLPQNYTIREHSYMWRADGSSSTQGAGSISNWPTITSGTATATLSQVTTSPDGWMPPGSGTLIKIDCTAGASPGVIALDILNPSQSIDAIGNHGFYWYDPTGDSTKYLGPNWRIGTAGYAAYFRHSASNVDAVNPRRKGWNLVVVKQGDENLTVGGMTYATTATRMRIDVTPVANQSFTLYFGDFIKGFYTKPQIMVWAADNLKDGYDTMFAYMNAAGRKIPGSYMPTTDYLAVPLGTQITVPQLQEMQSAGWTIVPHQTVGTSFTSMTEAQLRAEIDEVLAIHTQYGFDYQTFFYPPGGASNDLVNAVYSSYGIRYGNNANVSNVKLSRPLYGGVFNPYNLWSYSCDGKSAADVQAVIDHAVKYGGFTGLLWHDGSGDDTAVFRQSIDYLLRLRDANVLDVVSYQTFFNRLTDPRWVRA